MRSQPLGIALCGSLIVTSSAVPMAIGHPAKVLSDRAVFPTVFSQENQSCACVNPFFGVAMEFFDEPSP